MWIRTDSILVTGDASGRLLLWSLDQPTRGEAIAVFESPDNCHGAITHIRILSSNLILFGSADGSVGFLQRPRTKEQWLVRSRPQRLHRRAVRASGAFYSHKGRGLGLFTGAEDALLCVITDVTQHLQVPGKVQRIGALRTPAMAPAVCWPDRFGTCLLPQKPARCVSLQRTKAQAHGFIIDAVSLPADEATPRMGSAAAGTLLGHPKRTFWLELEAETVALYYRHGESAKQIPLSSRQIDALRGATRGIAALFNTFVVLARDNSCIQVLSVHRDSPESHAKVRLRSVTMLSTDAVCLTSDHEGGVGIGFANGTIQRFVVEPGERKPPKLKLVWTSQVQAAPCAMYLDSSTKTIWTIDGAHWLSENGEPRMLLPTPAEGCYSLLWPGPNHSLLAC
ncbi:hypothetical protein F1559_003687 [Cyanidiococcus yangmingshanensis]|uniref:Uncharacterized protein n=1 Tax=Cyanidiococcus yangmingshanensis TaxID=2690220 RepID=A0A7J7IFP5_9RHOD|nr:hypothetical protein F1559_003687 [Cyanidiococcus yangmingshanensis]